MHYFCNSWHVRNLLVMMLRFNKSLHWAESIVNVYTGLLRRSTDLHPFVLCRLHSSRVIDNATDDQFLLPRMFMPKEVHLIQQATKTYPITPS